MEAPKNLTCPKCHSRDRLEYDGADWYCVGCDGTMDGDTVYVDATAVERGLSEDDPRRDPNLARRLAE